MEPVHQVQEQELFDIVNFAGRGRVPVARQRFSKTTSPSGLGKAVGWVSGGLRPQIDHDRHDPPRNPTPSKKQAGYTTLHSIAAAKMLGYAAEFKLDSRYLMVGPPLTQPTEH